eukprot:jgi/Mesvir1/11027/Mv21444-RA.1
MGNVLDTLRGLVDGLVVRAYPYLHGHRDDPDELYRGYTNREAYEQFLADVDREIRLREEKGHSGWFDLATREDLESARQRATPENWHEVFDGLYANDPERTAVAGLAHPSVT